MKKVGSNERGFTLLEIIVVLAVLGALASMLAPVVFRYIDDANQARAQADTRTIAASIGQMYKDTGRWPYYAATTGQGPVAFAAGDAVILTSNPACDTGDTDLATFLDRSGLELSDISRRGSWTRAPPPERLPWCTPHGARGRAIRRPRRAPRPGRRRPARAHRQGGPRGLPGRGGHPRRDGVGHRGRRPGGSSPTSGAPATRRRSRSGDGRATSRSSRPRVRRAGVKGPDGSAGAGGGDVVERLGTLEPLEPVGGPDDAPHPADHVVERH